MLRNDKPSASEPITPIFRHGDVDETRHGPFETCSVAAIATPDGCAMNSAEREKERSSSENGKRA
jgi:hypothetical protein